MSKIIIDNNYKNWLTDLKSKIAQSQIKASIAVNSELISLYWDIGKRIVALQEQTKWGDSLIEQVTKDLKNEFPSIAGFSRSNIYYMRQFYLFYSNSLIVQQLGGRIEDDFVQQPVGLLQTKIIELPVRKFDYEFVQQLVGQIPWGHNVLILMKVKQVEEAVFYIKETIANNWSRNILGLQIENDLYNRQGKAISNFELTLPKPESDLARQTLKDPYIFDFLTLEKNVQELNFEKKLTENITQFLLELGKGFAFIGRQYPIEVSKKEYFIDLLFYHTKLHAYVVIELKMGEFEPEYIGKLNFYLSAINATYKTESDNPSIGILLCKTKDKLEVEFALKDINKPIGVSEFRFNELPLDIKSEMPTVEELESELFRYDNK